MVFLYGYKWCGCLHGAYADSKDLLFANRSEQLPRFVHAPMPDFLITVPQADRGEEDCGHIFLTRGEWSVAG